MPTMLVVDILMRGMQENSVRLASLAIFKLHDFLRLRKLNFVNPRLPRGEAQQTRALLLFTVTDTDEAPLTAGGPSI